MSKAPNTPSLPAYAAFQALGYTVFLLLILPLLLYRTLLHLHPATRPHPAWSYRRDIAIAFGGLYLACTTYFCLPRPPGKQAWQEDALLRKQLGESLHVEVVGIPPLPEEWVVGIAAEGGAEVVPESVPGFWTFGPAQNIQCGEERAREGERVVLYVAGGYVMVILVLV